MTPDPYTDLAHLAEELRATPIERGPVIAERLETIIRQDRPVPNENGAPESAPFMPSLRSEAEEPLPGGSSYAKSSGTGNPPAGSPKQQLYGSAEIAAHCNVSRQTVANWQRQAHQYGFPQPLARLRATNVYDGAEIRKWFKAWKRGNVNLDRRRSRYRKAVKK